LEGGFAGVILWLIHPELVGSSLVLHVLLVSVPPMVLVQAVVMRLNQFVETGRITLIGVVRLVTLLVLLPVLAVWFGLVGTGVAFLVANTAGAVVALVFEPGYARVLLVLWGITVLGVFAPLLTPGVSYMVSGSLYTLVSILLMHVSGVYRLGELVGSVRIVWDSVRR
jgi:O-antigen/teichoic acid export membrane protein